MGNKYISHALTLLFLAVWHGTDLCYFTSFTHEFMVVNAEKEFWSASEKIPLINGLPSWFKAFIGKDLRSWIFFKSLRKLLGYVYINVTWGFASIDFRLGSSQAFLRVWRSVYHCHQIFFLTMWTSSLMFNRITSHSKQKTQ